MCPIMGARSKAKPAKDYVDIIRNPGPTSIIKVREAMATLATDLRTGHVSPVYAATAIEACVKALHRKPPVRVAPKRIKPLSDEAKAHIRRYAAQWPDMSQLELANRFNTNPGRISEALNEGRE